MDYYHGTSSLQKRNIFDMCRKHLQLKTVKRIMHYLGRHPFLARQKNQLIL